MITSAVALMGPATLATAVTPGGGTSGDGAGTGSLRPFTAEVMLQNSGVGAVRFSADGAHLFFDGILPYSERSSGLENGFDRGRSILNIVDLKDGRQTRLHADQSDRTWYISQSPDGRHVLFGWLDGDIQRLGVLDAWTGQERRLRALASPMAESLPVAWLSDTIVVVATLSEEGQRRYVSPFTSEARLVRELERKSWGGREAGVKVVGAGTHEQPAQDQEPVQMLQVDVSTGEARVVLEGPLLMAQWAAPAGGRVAWIRRTGKFDITGIPGAAQHASSETARELLVHSLEEGTRSVPSPEGCSAESGGTIHWSPGGERILFSVRCREGDSLVHRQYIHDLRNRTVSPFHVQGVSFGLANEPEKLGGLQSPLVWLDEEHLAVGSGDPDAGYRWYLANRDGTVTLELTAGFPSGSGRSGFQAPILVHDGDLLMEVAGEVWRVNQRGETSSLTAGLGARVERWCPGTRPVAKCDMLYGVGHPGYGNRLLLQIMQDGVATGGLALLDLETSRIVRLDPPASDSRPLAASIAAGAAVHRRMGPEGDSLVLLREGGAVVELHRFNTHLADVAVPTPLLVTRREPGETEERNDWLLLPPDYRPGERRPLVVYFYPDTSYGKTLQQHDLRQVGFLNLSLVASQGYVVLLSSMKLPPWGSVEGNPMHDMHGQLIRSAGNVVRLGYADPGRWAVVGHSYGGYGVASVVTQTDRFKAAIAMSGVSNLITAYGSGLHTSRASGAGVGVHPGATWTWGQGRMGGAPWENPQRYLDNTPVLYADRVNTPLMLVHGDLDPVHVNQSEQMFLALQRLNKDVLLLRYWGEAHHFKSPANIIDLWERIGEFLREHLPLGQGRDAAHGAPGPGAARVAGVTRD